MTCKIHTYVLQRYTLNERLGVKSANQTDIRGRNWCSICDRKSYTSRSIAKVKQMHVLLEIVDAYPNKER